MAIIRANDDSCAQFQSKLRQELNVKGFYHSIELPDGRVLEGLLKIEKLKHRLAAMPIPQDLAGKRVLDIGTWDGYFAFEMEKRGAEVMAIDNVEMDNFHVAHRLLNSRVDYRVMSVYELSPERVGYFDYVLFLGVLYHLKHPLLALEAVCSVTRTLAMVESFVTNETAPEQNGKAALPVMEFYETDDLLGEVDNWVGPNVECLLAFCRTAGFARNTLLEVHQQRGLVASYRQWAPEPAAPTEAAPRLNAAVHTVNYGINFDSKRDPYVSTFFKTDASALTLDTVMPEVGAYGIRPVAVVRQGVDGAQANFRLPPGLEPGWHEVRVRTAGSVFSNPVRIAVDMPGRAEALSITGACDAGSMKPDEIVRTAEPLISVWVAGLPENADRANIDLRLGGAKLDIKFLAPAGNDSPRQINAALGGDIAAGTHDLTVAIGETQSPPLPVRVV